jgi:hypothetical protein
MKAFFDVSRPEPVRRRDPDYALALRRRRQPADACKGVRPPSWPPFKDEVDGRRGHRLPLPGGREHPNLPLETAAQSILLGLQVVARLKVQPEALGGAEVPR